MRRYHPDVTISPREKVVFGDLAREIIAAYQAGDAATLREIERLGTAFRKAPPPPPPAAGAPRRRYAPRRPETPPRNEAPRRWKADYLKRCLWSAAPILFPYSLASAIKSWDRNGKALNAACIVGAVPWIWLGMQTWGGIDILAAWLEKFGYSHETFVGLGVVVLRGALIALLLPIALPLAAVALRAGIVLGVAVVAHFVLSGILGLFHPYLPWVATISVAVGVAVALWDSLDEW